MGAVGSAGPSLNCRHCRAVILVLWTPSSLRVKERASTTFMPRNVNSGLLETRRSVNGAPDRDIVTLTVAITLSAGASSGVFVLLGVTMTLLANVPSTGAAPPISTQARLKRIQ